MIMSKRLGIPNMVALRRFYESSVYRELEREESKYWWMSPEQLCDSVIECSKPVTTYTEPRMRM